MHYALCTMFNNKANLFRSSHSKSNKLNDVSEHCASSQRAREGLDILEELIPWMGLHISVRNILPINLLKNYLPDF